MRQCEICGNELQAHQQRFCCRKCRNSAAGRASAAKFKLPDRKTLAEMYLLPPDGQGMSFDTIAPFYGVSDVTIRNWVKAHGLLQDTKERLRYHQKQNAKPRIPVPPESELAALYKMPPVGKGLTQNQLASHYDVDRGTARRWLQLYNLLEPHSERHSKRMAGKGSHAWNGGTSRGYHKNVLRRSGKVKQCEWCGTTEKLQVHHINHDTKDGNLDNLTWLCGYCNRLEAQLWNLVQSDRATIEWEAKEGRKTLKIKFSERS